MGLWPFCFQIRPNCMEFFCLNLLIFTGHTSVELSKHKNRIRNISGRRNYPLLIISQPSVHPPFKSSSHPFNSPKICHADGLCSVTYRSQRHKFIYLRSVTSRTPRRTGSPLAPTSLWSRPRLRRAICCICACDGLAVSRYSVVLRT
jgi:hypothetical protein